MQVLSINQALPKCLVTNNTHKSNQHTDRKIPVGCPCNDINYLIFTSKLSEKPQKLSVEIQKAFESKDMKAKKNYFKNLADNYSLILRNCSDNEYIKTVQVLLDNVKYDRKEGKDLFENQINLLSASVRPNVGMEKYINPDNFNKNFKDFIYDDDGVINKIERILKITTAKDTKLALDVNSHSKYPINILSNFAKTDFELDGVKIKSMEGFLQSLKTPNKEEQEYICSLDGLKAKGMGKKLNKQRNYDFKHLFWQGKRIDRKSKEYQELLKSAYNERFKNDEDFRFALEYTKDYELTHKIGEDDPKRTLLTPKEFVGILNELRQNI